MPVQPLPCGPDGGSGTPGACSCAPSIATSPLCRADGTSIVVVVRSECAACGDPVADPAVIGWVDPATGAYTAGAVPADAGPCTLGCSCSPSIATAPMCRADGTSVLVVVRSDCDTPAPDPAVVGWIDPLTGVFTPGAAPADAGPCAPGCVETICRQRCDDTTGDGQADTTYSESWCIHPDGTAALLLTYQDDPSVPYTPTAPVDCTYGSVETETVMLCDDGGPFLRRYTFLDGTATYEDVGLDGATPHVVTGTVGACAAEAGGGTPCAEQTTPAATLGLCLTDGTPIAVVVTQDCNGAVSQDGWLNLTTGAYTTGPPPTGAQACGDSRAFELAGLLCDTLPDGTVAGLVLVEYEYAPDGSLAEVRLVDPGTGNTYVLQGTLRYCPAQEGQGGPESDVVVLCDTATDGTTTSFLRDFHHDAAGQITGHTDYALDGTAYTAAGTVGLCSPSADGFDVELVPLCVVDDGNGALLQRILAEIRYDAATGTRVSVTYVDPHSFGPVALPGGTHIDACPQEVPPAGRDVETQLLCLFDAFGNLIGRAVAEWVYNDQTGARVAMRLVDPLSGAALLVPPGSTLGVCAPPAEPCRNATSVLLCDFPTDGQPAAAMTDTPPAPYYPYVTGAPVTGAQPLWDGGGTLTIPAASAPQPGATGAVATLAATLQAARPACDAGTAHVTVSVDVAQLGPDTGCAATGYLRLFDGPSSPIALAVTPNGAPAGWSGTLTVEADVPVADLAAGTIAVLVALDTYDDSPTACPGSPRRTGWDLSQFTVTVAFDQTGCAPQFLRTVTVDCETGAVTAVVDTTLDGDPYTVTGQPGQCTAVSSGTPAQPCGDTELVELCDLQYDPQAPIPTPAGDFTLTGNVVTANNGTTLWFAQANQVANGTAELTVGGLLPAVKYEFRFASAWIGAGGPDPATNNAIYLLEILDGTTVLASRNRNVSNGSSVFPGGVLTEDLPPLAFTPPASGTVTIRFTDQTTGGAINDRDLFLMPLEVRTEALTLTSTPFLRRFTFDCGGAVTTSQDLSLDGVTPYTVVGEAGHCPSDGTAGSATVACSAQNVIEACRCDDTDGDGLADLSYVELLAVDCNGTLSSLGTYTADLSAPYTPLAPVDCDETDQGADPTTGVQTRRVELAAGGTWDAAAWPTLQSVTAVAHGGAGTVTTADGPSTLHTGEAVTWSVGRDADALLRGPLTITADTGTVTISYTIGVQL